MNLIGVLSLRSLVLFTKYVSHNKFLKNVVISDLQVMLVLMKSLNCRFI